MMAIELALNWAGTEAQKQEEQAWCPVGVPGFSILRLLQLVILLSHFLLLVHLYPSP